MPYAEEASTFAIKRTAHYPAKGEVASLAQGPSGYLHRSSPTIVMTRWSTGRVRRDSQPRASDRHAIAKQRDGKCRYTHAHAIPAKLRSHGLMGLTQHLSQPVDSERLG